MKRNLGGGNGFEQNVTWKECVNTREVFITEVAQLIYWPAPFCQPIKHGTAEYFSSCVFGRKGSLKLCSSTSKLQHHAPPVLTEFCVKYCASSLRVKKCNLSFFPHQVVKKIYRMGNGDDHRIKVLNAIFSDCFLFAASNFFRIFTVNWGQPWPCLELDVVVQSHPNTESCSHFSACSWFSLCAVISFCCQGLEVASGSQEGSAGVELEIRICPGCQELFFLQIIPFLAPCDFHTTAAFFCPFLWG